MAVFRSREVFIKLYPTLHHPTLRPYVEGICDIDCAIL